MNNNSNKILRTAILLWAYRPGKFSSSSPESRASLEGESTTVVDKRIKTLSVAISIWCGVTSPLALLPTGHVPPSSCCDSALVGSVANDETRRSRAVSQLALEWGIGGLLNQRVAQLDEGAVHGAGGAKGAQFQCGCHNISQDKS